MPTPDATSSTMIPRLTPSWRRSGTVFVIGVDGLTLDVIAPMIARGELPTFARLAKEGCSGPLATILPTDSPVIWTTIATGRHYRDHGIEGFHRARILGANAGHASVRRAKRLGFKYPMRLLMRLGLMERHLYDARDVRAKRFWDIISECGGRVGVVNWWNTWPATALNGFMVSDRLHYWRMAAKGEPTPQSGLVSPATMLDDIRGLVIPPDRVSVEEIRQFVRMPEAKLAEFLHGEFSHHELSGELRILISADRTYLQVFERCTETHPGLSLAVLYLRGPDIAQHCAFDFMPTALASGATEEQRREFGEVAPQAYRMADEMVGRAIARMRPEDTVFVLSDHGYAYDAKRGAYGHARGRPPGVLYCVGKEFQRGVSIRAAGVFDFAPTLLRVYGLPRSLNMPGRCLEELFTPEFRAAHPAPQPIRNYSPPRPIGEAGADSGEVDKEVTEHLRALGYMD